MVIPGENGEWAGFTNGSEDWHREFRESILAVRLKSITFLKFLPSSFKLFIRENSCPFVV